MTTIANRFVAWLLRSPLHRMMSGSVCLVRYTGRRTGRAIMTPTLYALHGDGLVILVGRHEQKTWWRNFTLDWDIEVLLLRKWLPMSARAVVGANEPVAVAPLLDAYLQRFPKALGSLGGKGYASRTISAVVVWCQPRTSLRCGHGEPDVEAL